MPDAATIVRTYIEMWNETDPERRLALVSQTLTLYVTPVFYISMEIIQDWLKGRRAAKAPVLTPATSSK